MRFPLGVLIITLVSVGTLQAQSLTDIARRERARRAMAALAIVFSNENISVGLPALALAPPLVDRDEEGSGTDGVSQDAPEEARDPEAASEEERAEWEAAVAEQRAVVQDLEDRELRQQLEINRLRNLFTAPVTTQAERAQAQAGLEGAQTQLEAIRTQLAAARTALDDLLAQEPGGL